MYTRNCPSCNKIITHTTERKCKQSKEKNCLSCSKKGNNNPMHGKCGDLSPRFGKEGLKGEQNPAKKESTRIKISNALKGRNTRPGYSHSEETKSRISKGNTGKKRSTETCSNIQKSVVKLLESGKSNNPWAKKENFNNTSIHYQGSYELDFLNRYYEKIDIENGKTFYYVLDSNRKAYISDFFLPKYNMIVEIKSSYTKKNHIDKLKENSVIDSGLQFIMILDKDYTEFSKLFD